MKIKGREDNKNEDDKNEINVKRNAMSDDDDEIIKDNHHSENFYQS